MKYIDHELGQKGLTWYTHDQDQGQVRESTTEELDEAFGALPHKFSITRNGLTFNYYIRQNQKSGIAYWSPTITPSNLQDFIKFLGEQKTISFLQVRINQLVQELTINREVRSADYKSCDKELVESRLTRLSGKDPNSMSELREEMMTLMKAKLSATTLEDIANLDSKLLINLEKQVKKIKTL